MGHVGVNHFEKVIFGSKNRGYLWDSKTWNLINTDLKNVSQLGLLFPIYGKIKMVQTTNQYIYPEKK